MFGSSEIQLSDRITLHVLNIEKYDDHLLSKIRSEIGKIWNGDNEDDDLEIVKLEIKNLLHEHRDDRQKYGTIAEFICHLYLRTIDHEQHFLFRNLEEKGMKKGFDGLYMKDDEYWIYESKSTLPTTDSNHNSNISEAYNDLKNKLEGRNTTNNPWKNAIIHANNYAIKRNETLVKTIKAFSNDYVKSKFYKVSNFNIIPSSTIYLESKWCQIDPTDLSEKLKSLTSRYDCKKLTVLCINKKSIVDFIDFING